MGIKYISQIQKFKYEIEVINRIKWNLIHIDLALNIVYQFQEKQHKRKASEQKMSKEKLPRKFPMDI